MNNLKTDILPEAAKKELQSFYDYLMYKYLRTLGSSKEPVVKRKKNLAAFHRFKKLRDQIKPVVDKSIDIDKLANEVSGKGSLIIDLTYKDSSEIDKIDPEMRRSQDVEHSPSPNSNPLS